MIPIIKTKEDSESLPEEKYQGVFYNMFVCIPFYGFHIKKSVLATIANALYISKR